MVFGAGGFLVAQLVRICLPPNHCPPICWMAFSASWNRERNSLLHRGKNKKYDLTQKHFEFRSTEVNCEKMHFKWKGRMLLLFFSLFYRDDTSGKPTFKSSTNTMMSTYPFVEERHKAIAFRFPCSHIFHNTSISVDKHTGKHQGHHDTSPKSNEWQRKLTLSTFEKMKAMNWWHCCC